MLSVSITDKQKKKFVILALIMLTLAVYWQVQNFGFVNYDDNLYVTQNHQIQSGFTYKGIVKIFTDIRTGNWHPLTMISHMLDWELFGQNAGGHHWSSLILHIINTVLLFLLLNQMTGAIWRSALVAVLFAIHPINVESVAWIAERKNVLNTFFWFLTMLFYVGYVRQPGWKRYLPVLICFALGLMSKAMLVTLPFVLLLIDYWPLNRTAIYIQGELVIQPSSPSAKAKLSFLIWEKIPLFVLTGIFVFVTLYAQHAVGALVKIDHLPLFERISNAILSYGLYIKKMFWPFDLSIFYPRYSIAVWELFAVSVLLIFVTVFVLRYCRKYPYLMVGWFWYLGTMVPVIGLVQVGAQSMADRYAYVPFVGLFIMLAWWAADCAGKNKYKKLYFVTVSLFLISSLSVISWQRCQLWGDEVALWNDALRNHKVAITYNLRGVAYANKGQYGLALADYKSALDMDKKFAEAFNNRGNLYVAMGQYENALRDFEEVQRIKPGYADTHYNRGILHLKKNQIDAAIADFSKAIDIDPDNADYFNNRGVALSIKGEYEKSFADFNQALRLNQNLAEAYFNRGRIYKIHRQYYPAIMNFTEALNIKPAYVDARINRGMAFAALDKFNLAIADFSYVLQVDPKHVSALNNLGLVLKEMGRYEESAEQYRKILQIKPDDHNAREQLKEIANLERKDKPVSKE